MKNLKDILNETAELLGDDTSVLIESMLDPVNKTRCKDIFDDNDIMLPKVVKYIEDTFKLWYDQLDKKVFDIVTFKCIGSSTGYQYTDSSDLDVQAFIRMKEGHDFSETKELIDILPNGNNLPGTQHPVNYFFVDEKNPTDMKKVENLYDVRAKKWEKKQEAGTNNVPVTYVREITRFFTDAFDLLMGRFDRDYQYLKDAIKYNPKTQQISKAEKEEAMNNCVTQLKADLDSLKLAYRLIHGFRLQAYDENNFFHINITYMDDNDPRKSMNEAIYKTLDKFEYVERMWEKEKEGWKLLESIGKG